MLVKKILQGEKSDQVPFWFMRQAGRYMSEYMEIKNRFNAAGKGFLDMCYDVETASEITMQPVLKFNTSAAIVFSDIMTVPDSMGVPVQFVAGSGPVLKKFETKKDLENFDLNDTKGIFDTVGKVVKSVREKLDKDKTLIGFSAAPFTLACYMIQGSASKDFTLALKMMWQEEDLFNSLLDVLTERVCASLAKQIQNGADVVQIFDSHAGLLSEKRYEKHIININKKVVDFIRTNFPNTPIICFPRGSGSRYIDFCDAIQPNGISLDNSCNIEFFAKNINKKVVLQGNLNNYLLCYGNMPEVLQEANGIIQICKKYDRQLIFNLSHGVLKETLVERVQEISKW